MTCERRRDSWPAAGVCLVLGLLVGCSDRPPVYPVRGQVVMADGRPVDSGFLEFRNDDLPYNGRARIQKDGTYQLTTFDEFDGAVAGKHQVILVQHVIAEVQRPAEHRLPEQPEPQQHANHVIVDTRFRSYETSPLEFEVEAKSENVIDIKVF